MADQPYYNIGTATLTAGSTSMVGQGTLWVGNTRFGDVVFPSAGGPNIVADVVDNTHITLMFPATVAQAAQSYAVMYTPDDPFTQTELRKLLKTLSTSALATLGNLVPVAKKGIRFDGAASASLIDISDAALSLLDDASVSAMLTTLGVSSFAKTILDDADGSSVMTTLGVSAFIKTLLDDADAATARATLGANDAGNLSAGTLPDARVSTSLTADKAFRRGNINGTVSMSGGVPSGALFEGGIASGRGYLRFANGMQICWGAPGTQMNPTNVATGGGFQATSGNTYGFVAAFTLAPTVVAGASFSSTARGWVSLLDVPTTTSVSLIAHSFASGALIVPYYMAIGWWF